MFSLLDARVDDDIASNVDLYLALACPYVSKQRNFRKICQLCPPVFALPFLAGLYHVAKKHRWNPPRIELARLLGQRARDGVNETSERNEWSFEVSPVALVVSRFKLIFMYGA